MAGVIKSTGSFVRALGAPFAAFAAAIQDPFRWLVQAGFMTAEPAWLVSAEWRQFGLLVFASVWLLVWYHRQRIRFEESQPPTPNMPLYRVVRYVGEQSEWAAKQEARHDEKWIERVDPEVQTKLINGEIAAFGIFRPYLKPSGRGHAKIKPEFWENADWHSSHMVLADPPTHIWHSSSHGGGIYTDVKLDSRQVERAWPKMSFWDRVRGKSPVARSGGYREIWKKQDERYPLIRDGEDRLEDHAVYAEMFGDEHGRP